MKRTTKWAESLIADLKAHTEKFQSAVLIPAADVCDDEGGDPKVSAMLRERAAELNA